MAILQFGAISGSGVTVNVFVGTGVVTGIGEGVIEGVNGVRLGSVDAVAVIAEVGGIPPQAVKKRRPMIYTVLGVIEITFIQPLNCFFARVFCHWWIHRVLMMKTMGQ